jgi:hypothetical protein
MICSIATDQSSGRSAYLVATRSRPWRWAVAPGEARDAAPASRTPRRAVPGRWRPARATAGRWRRRSGGRAGGRCGFDACRCSVDSLRRPCWRTSGRGLAAPPVVGLDHTSRSKWCPPVSRAVCRNLTRSPVTGCSRTSPAYATGARSWTTKLSPSEIVRLARTTVKATVWLHALRHARRAPCFHTHGHKTGAFWPHSEANRPSPGVGEHDEAALSMTRPQRMRITSRCFRRPGGARVAREW